MTKGRRPEHRREEILEVGCDLFNRHGYHATGLNTILEACQVSKGSFYNFFGSKEQFAVEIIEHYHSIECERWEQEYALLDVPLFEKMRIMLQREIAKFEENQDYQGCLIANLSGELGNATDSFKAAIRKSTREVLDGIAAYFAQCQDEGSVRKDMTACQLAEFFWDSWQGAFLRMKVEGTTAPLRSTIDLLWNHLLPPSQTGAAQ